MVEVSADPLQQIGAIRQAAEWSKLRVAERQAGGDNPHDQGERLQALYAELASVVSACRLVMRAGQEKLNRLVVRPARTTLLAEWAVAESLLRADPAIAIALDEALVRLRRVNAALDEIFIRVDAAPVTGASSAARATSPRIPRAPRGRGGFIMNAITAAEPPRQPRPNRIHRHVLFGTDRAPDERARGGYGSGRSGELVLGEGVVSLPRGRARGKLPRPGKFLFWTLAREDPGRHVMLARPPSRLTREAFLAGVEGVPEPAFLFIHGYNTSFEGGLFRTAQLAVDLEITGPVFHYSWPSAGNLLRYDYDDQSAQQARRHLRDFLSLIVTEAGVSKLNVLAHSKGNELLLDALDFWAEGERGRCGQQLVLASPDVDVDFARQVIPRTSGLFDGVTLYANGNDRPLMISSGKASAPRAGGLLADGAPLIVSGADSIDATQAEFDIFGLNHDVYVDEPVLMYDILALFQRGTRPPDQRNPSLRPATSPRGAYWRLVTS